MPSPSGRPAPVVSPVFRSRGPICPPFGAGAPACPPTGRRRAVHTVFPLQPSPIRVDSSPGHVNHHTEIAKGDTRPMRRRQTKILLTLLVIGVIAGAVGFGTFSAFSSTTDNQGNSFAAGTVYISDNDAGSALYNVSNKKPGDTAQGCIK